MIAMEKVVIIPAYNPDEVLKELVHVTIIAIRTMEPSFEMGQSIVRRVQMWKPAY